MAAHQEIPATAEATETREQLLQRLTAELGYEPDLPREGHRDELPGIRKDLGHSFSPDGKYVYLVPPPRRDSHPGEFVI